MTTEHQYWEAAIGYRGLNHKVLVLATDLLDAVDRLKESFPDVKVFHINPSDITLTL